MAHITTQSPDKFPVLEINVVGDTTNILTVPCLQDITINNSTGVYSYTAFCSVDTQKITTPGDNSIEANIVIDDDAFFGLTSAPADSATKLGIAGLSQNRVEVAFKLYWAGKSTAATDLMSTGTGFITSLAPTVSPEAPIWLTPVTIAVNGAMVTARNG
jgi:hypothetical protein